MPASEPRKVTKAFATSADEVVVDLEDAVAAERKSEARLEVRRLPARTHGAVAVRVNAIGSPWFAEDLDACVTTDAVHSIVVPKVETDADLVALDRELDERERMARRAAPLRVQALIESPAGLANVRRIAVASARLESLIIGYADLAASLGRRPEASWQFAQDSVLLAARLAGVQAIDGPVLSVDADESLRLASAHAQALGFDGKWVIHPRQVPTVLTAFTPTVEETERARGILAALDDAAGRGEGAVQWQGQMLDEAVAVQARRTLSRVIR